MKKSIKDYMHLYLGQQFLYRVLDVETEQSKPMELTADQLSVFYDLVDDPNCQYKLMLRPLSSMDVKEIIAYEKTMELRSATAVHKILVNHETPETFKWLLSNGFDLFGLIEAGLAIDKTKQS